MSGTTTTTITEHTAAAAAVVAVWLSNVYTRSRVCVRLVERPVTLRLFLKHPLERGTEDRVSLMRPVRCLVHLGPYCRYSKGFMNCEILQYSDTNNDRDGLKTVSEKLACMEVETSTNGDACGARTVYRRQKKNCSM